MELLQWQTSTGDAAKPVPDTLRRQHSRHGYSGETVDVQRRLKQVMRGVTT